MAYSVNELRKAAVAGKQAQIDAYRERIARYYDEVSKSRIAWRERYLEDWRQSLTALLEQLKEDKDSVITAWDIVSRDTGGVRRSPRDGMLPPTWNEFNYETGKRIEKPNLLDISQFSPDPVFDRIITLCDLTRDAEITNNAMKNAGFSQADFGKLLTLLSRYSVTVSNE